MCLRKDTFESGNWRGLVRVFVGRITNTYDRNGTTADELTRDQLSTDHCLANEFAKFYGNLYRIKPTVGKCVYLCLDDHDNQNKDITIGPCCARVLTKTKVSDDDEYHVLKSPSRLCFVHHKTARFQFANVDDDFTKNTISKRIEREIIEHRIFYCLQNNKTYKGHQNIRSIQHKYKRQSGKNTVFLSINFRKTLKSA